MAAQLKTKQDSNLFVLPNFSIQSVFHANRILIISKFETIILIR